MCSDPPLRAVLDSPDADEPRLAYADWLERNDQPEFAAFIRVQVKRARTEDAGERPALEAEERELLKAFVKIWLAERLSEYLKDESASLEKRAFARTHLAIPLLVGWFSVLWLRFDGCVVDADEENGTVTVVEDARIRNVVLLEGSKRYPKLRLLVPPKPMTAQKCQACNGTGVLALPPKFANIICQCGGCGWLP